MNNQHKFHTIDGKTLAEEKLHEVRKKIVESKITPGLAVILVGDDKPSHLYVKNKEKACQKVGIDFHKYLCNEGGLNDISEKSLLEMIEFLNQDPAVSGIVIQLPLPKKYNTEKIISAIAPEKDADGFHPKNIQKILGGKTKKYPPLVKTILSLIESEKIELKNKKVLVLVKSDVLVPLMKRVFEDAGCHIQFSDFHKALEKKLMRDADIIISILGKPKCITGDMLKNNAVVIDVGITKTPQGLCGDANFESIKKTASCATPTPGGVGPMTIAMLLDNVFDLAVKQHQSS